MIRTAFARLIKNASLDVKHCYCFFIDGLDEYQETAQSDLKELVNLLTGWTTAAPRQVKLCVSSREHNVFVNAFSAEQRLRLHELTWLDMAAYARGKLDDVSDQDAKFRLIRAIIGKAEGIFLWVSLVVKQMRDQLENGADIAALMQLVDSLPDELDSLYEHTLKSLSKRDRRKGYMTLAMLPLATKWALPLHVFAYSFFDQYDKDTEFAEREDFTRVGMAGMAFEERLQLGRKRLNGWCKGLVESRQGILEYAHRSIPDFLENMAVKDEMESCLVGFSPAYALSQFCLALIRFENWDSDDDAPDSTSRGLSRFVRSLVMMRHVYGLDHAPFTFLRRLDVSVMRWVWRELETSSTQIDIYLPTPTRESCCIAAIPAPRERPYRSPVRYLPSALYLCTFLFENHQYPVWSIANDPTTTDATTKVVLFAYCLFSRQFYSHNINFSILDALLERGHLMSKTRTRLTLGECSFKDEEGRDTPVPRYGRIELSVWQHYLICEWISHQGLVSSPQPDSFRRVRLSLFGAVIEWFLRRDAGAAESRLTASVSRLDKTRVKFAFGGDPAGDGEENAKNLVDVCFVGGGSEQPIDQLEVAVSACPATGWEAKLVYLCSLRSWVEGLDGIPNKAEVLQLLDQEDSSPGDDPSPSLGSKVSGRMLQATLERICVGYATVLTVGKSLLLQVSLWIFNISGC
jgi:hypothetical protein